MRLFLFSFFVLISFPIRAVIAYTYPIKVSTQKGYATIYLCGNEHCKYAITSDGYPIVHDKDSWFHAFCDDNGNLHKTEFLVEEASLRSNELKTFLSTLNPNFKVSAIDTNEKNYIENHNKTSIIGNRKILVILAQFPNKKNVHSVEDFQQLFNGINYSEDGAKGSVCDYFRYASYNTLQLECDIIGPFTSKQVMSYYGGNRLVGGQDKNPYALFEEAIEYASTQVNLDDYDSDKDGYMDNVHIIYAGYGEEAGASSDAIWAHEMRFEPIEYQNVKIDRYSCAPELRSNSGNGISRIGPHCHEIGHALGAMDYYDTDYQKGGNFEGTGKWDIMASGSWNNEGISPANFNPYVKAYNFGWCNVTSLSEEGKYICFPINTNNEIYRINTPKNGEFYLVENRQQEEFDSSVPGHGLLIYHIDANIDHTSLSNTINACYPQNCYIVCANSKNKHHSSNANSYGDVNSSGCSYPGTSNNNSFDNTSIPSALCNDGTFSGIYITNIQEDNKCISFTFYKDDTPDQPDDTPTGDKIVWEDAFEGYFLDYRWQQQSVLGNSSWQVKKSFGGNIINSYLLLSPVFSPLDNNDKKVVTRLYFSLNDIENGEYVLSLQMANSGVNPNGNIDSLYIFTTNVAKECISGRTEIDVNSSQWSTHVVKMEKNSDTQYVCIEGVCYKGTSLMIDDFTMLKRSVTDINKTYRDSSQNPKTYLVNGVITCPYSKGILIRNGKKIIHSR